MPLVPARAEQLGYAVLCGNDLVTPLQFGRFRLQVIIDDVLNLVGIELKPGAHVLGDVVRVERALLHITEDWFYAVVARYNDIAAVISGIEDIVVGRPRHSGLDCGLAVPLKGIWVVSMVFPFASM